MPRWQRIYVIACASVIGFALGYIFCDFGQWPKLTYFPIEGEWRWFRTPPGPIPMPYVGMILWGLAGSVVVAALAALITRRVRSPLGETMLRLWGGWALTAFVFGGLYFTWNLWPF